MSNIPLGAEGDPLAPYNFDEKVFKFSVEVKGDFYYEYSGELDKDESDIARLLKERIADLIGTQGDIDLSCIEVCVD